MLSRWKWELWWELLVDRQEGLGIAMAHVMKKFLVVIAWVDRGQDEGVATHFVVQASSLCDAYAQAEAAAEDKEWLRKQLFGDRPETFACHSILDTGVDCISVVPVAEIVARQPVPPPAAHVAALKAL